MNEPSLSADNEIPVAPPSEVERRFIPATGLKPPLTFDLPEPEQRFSLRALLVTMTLAVGVMAVGRFLQPEWFAFLCGTAALATLIVSAVANIRAGWIQLVFWMFMAIYAIAAWAIHHDGV